MATRPITTPAQQDLININKLKEEVGEIIEQGISFFNWISTGPDEEVEQYLKDFPRKSNRRIQAINTLLGYALPRKILYTSKNPKKRHVSRDELRECSTEELKAIIQEEEEEE